MMRMVDMEQGRNSIGSRIGMTEQAIASLPTTTRKRIQLNTPEQSPAKPESRLGLETPEFIIVKEGKQW
jgi:hypothetical protein